MKEFGVVECQGRYADGKPKPRFRGALHAVVSGLLVLALIALVALVHLRVLERRRWLLGCFFLGKLASYGASAALHLGVFRDLPSLTRALRLDLLAIPVSIGANNLPLARSPTEFGALCGAALCFYVVNASCVERQLCRARGLANPDDRSDTPRSVVLSLHCLFSYWHIRLRRGTDALFYANVVLVVLTLALSVPVSAAHAQEPLDERLPWHRRRVWGFHEDMHVVLLVGDLTMFAMVAGGTVWDPGLGLAS